MKPIIIIIIIRINHSQHKTNYCILPGRQTDKISRRKTPKKQSISCFGNGNLTRTLLTIISIPFLDKDKDKMMREQKEKTEVKVAAF